MQLELNLLDVTKSEEEIVTSFFKGMGSNITIVTIPVIYAGKLKQYSVANKIACPVDYPFGFSKSSLRQHECILAIRNGADCIDLMINPTHLYNGNKHELVEDIKSIKNICDSYEVELRAMLDYRMYTDSGLVLSVCSLLKRLGIEYVIPSSGQFVDDITDNIIMCELISNKNPGLKTILNTSYCSKTQFDKIPKSIFGVRLKSFNFGV